MARLMATIPATLSRLSGFTPQGRQLWGAETVLRVAIVSLRSRSEGSSVRADSSASRGRAEEIRADGVVLVPPEAPTVAVGDRLHMLGRSYLIISVFPRHGLHGELGHYQVELSALAGA